MWFSGVDKDKFLDMRNVANVFWVIASLDQG